MIDNIDENVLKNGKDGIKQNMLKVFDEFIDVYADEMWQIVNELIKLTTENAKLRAKLDKAVELPSGDRVWYIAEDEEGQESYIIPKLTSSLTVEELKYGMGRKYLSTREAAEARLTELKEKI